MSGPQPVPLVPGVLDGLGQPVAGTENCDGVARFVFSEPVKSLNQRLDDIISRLDLIEGGVSVVEDKLDQLARRIDSAIEASA